MSKRNEFSRRQLLKYTAAGSAAGVIGTKALGQAAAACVDTVPVNITTASNTGCPVDADLFTFGKVMGGGLPAAAFAGGNLAHTRVHAGDGAHTAHAVGQGAVIWVFISEIFPNRVRAHGQALGSFTHWTVCALVSWTFPVIASASGGHAFAFYAGMMVLQLLWVLLVMPETKGVSLEEIQKKLGIE